MNNEHCGQISRELSVGTAQVAAVAKLLEEGSTIPFIARYRKEATGSLDETVVMAIRDRLKQLADLDDRRETILKSIDEQGKLTPELKGKILKAVTLSELEDLYLPYKPKRRTRATIAKEKGLEELAGLVFGKKCDSPEKEAARFVDAEKGVTDTAEALAGARDIIAEWVSEDEKVRASLRRIFKEESRLVSRVKKGKEEEGQKYRDWFEWNEPLAKAPSHRILALFRGESEGFLSLSAKPEEDSTQAAVERILNPGRGLCADQIREAATDSCKRLLIPSLETEALSAARERAEKDAISVFQMNLRDLLMSAPLGEKAVLGVDPGFRTGCKLVCLDRQGKLLWHGVMYPLEPHGKVSESADLVRKVCDRYKVEAVAVGNGTGGRESLSFLRGLGLDKKIILTMVNESGASVYSASDVARKEFPDQDVTVRGAVSIGRRLLDPLSELVKIDPKSIGVGQYQHDVNQKWLQESLEDVVTECVNAVGVDLNTASAEILKYVSGMTAKTAAAVVKHRDSHGAYKKREELLKVTGLGPKAYEQAAGFLRIRGGREPLDASAVHPEAYPVVGRMAADLGCDILALMNDGSLRKKIRPEAYVTGTIGIPTIKDILAELEKPGRDPRDKFEEPDFNDAVNKMEDLEQGMILAGVVTNVTAFGAFVDIGVHQDGLVHISQLSDTFVKNVQDVVRVGQKVSVKVIEVDIPRKRISLSMKS
jgi:uncharacterized protein